MSQSYTLKPISHLSTASDIKDDDVLVISQKLNDTSEKYVSRKISLQKIVEIASDDIDDKILKQMQATLDNKLDKSGTANSAIKLAEAKTIHVDGDCSGSVAFDGSSDKTLTLDVKDDSHNHIISNITGLTAALNTKLNVDSNAVSASKLANERTISLKGACSGNVSFDGSKDVELDVLIADDSHNHIISNIDGLNLELNNKLNVDSNAVSASKLATPRAITLIGDCSGSVAFDGSSDVELIVEVQNNSHTHEITNVDGLNEKLNDIDATINNIIANVNENATVLNDTVKDVTVTPKYNEGTLLATIAVDGKESNIYVSNVNNGNMIGTASYTLETNHGTEADGSSWWYRIYSDGWCEQGGCGVADEVYGNDSGKLISIKKRYIDTGYLINLTHEIGNNVGCIGYRNKLNNSFVVIYRDNDETTAGEGLRFDWESRGYIDLTVVDEFIYDNKLLFSANDATEFDYLMLHDNTPLIIETK